MDRWCLVMQWIVAWASAPLGLWFLFGSRFFILPFLPDLPFFFRGNIMKFCTDLHSSLPHNVWITAIIWRNQNRNALTRCVRREVSHLHSFGLWVCKGSEARKNNRGHPDDQKTLKKWIFCRIPYHVDLHQVIKSHKKVWYIQKHSYKFWHQEVLVIGNGRKYLLK